MPVSLWFLIPILSLPYVSASLAYLHRPFCSCPSVPRISLPPSSSTPTLDNHNHNHILVWLLVTRSLSLCLELIRSFLKNCSLSSRLKLFVFLSVLFSATCLSLSEFISLGLPVCLSFLPSLLLSTWLSHCVSTLQCWG